MTVSAMLRQLEELADRIAALGRECDANTHAVLWQCAKGRRAAASARRLAGLTVTVATELREAAALLRVAWQV